MLYLIEKAQDFLKKGYLLYRNSDFFHLPPVDISPQEHAALYDICHQLVEQKGIFSYEPLVTSLSYLHVTLQAMHCIISEYNEEFVLVQHALYPEMKGKIYCLFTDMTPNFRPAYSFAKTKKKESAPQFPIVEYQPIITYSELVYCGTIHEYWYQLHVNCRTDSSIQYQSILVCIDPSRALPFFVVTEEIGMDCVFLCTFDSEGHHNYGVCTFDSVDEFLEAALPLVEEFLNHTEPERLSFNDSEE